MRAGWLAVAAVLFAGTASATPMLLSGTIGKAPVFLDLDRSSDTVSGWYFYLKVGKQIRLEGKLDGNGLFDIQEYVASTNTRTGSFKGRIKDGHWTGTWSDAQGRHPNPIAFDEVRSTLSGDSGRVRCAVRASDDFGGRSKQSLDMTLQGGKIKALSLKLSEHSDGGDTQSCAIALSDLKQVPSAAGITLKAKRGANRCTIRIYAAGSFLVTRIGDPSQEGDDCRGAGKVSFCTPRAFWLGLAVNRANQTCKQVK